jgi:hypothetical protein
MFFFPFRHFGLGLILIFLLHLLYFSVIILAMLSIPARLPLPVSSSILFYLFFILFKLHLIYIPALRCRVISSLWRLSMSLTLGFCAVEVCSTFSDKDMSCCIHFPFSYTNFPLSPVPLCLGVIIFKKFSLELPATQKVNIFSKFKFVIKKKQKGDPNFLFQLFNGNSKIYF